jgi:hypothetical protein
MLVVYCSVLDWNEIRGAYTLTQMPRMAAADTHVGMIPADMYRSAEGVFFWETTAVGSCSVFEVQSLVDLEMRHVVSNLPSPTYAMSTYAVFALHWKMRQDASLTLVS